MKKIILFTTLCLFSAHAHGIQKPEYTVNTPYFDSREQEYVIEAVNRINKPIGLLIYHPTTGNQWEMRKLEVDSKYRNKGVARALVEACIVQLKENNASHLSWKALPKEDNLTEEKLIAIYYQILQKIDPIYFAKTTLEYRGDENLQSPWLILDLE